MFHFWFLNNGQWQFIGTFDSRAFSGTINPGSVHVWGLAGQQWQYLGFLGRPDVFPAMNQARASGISNFYLLQPGGGSGGQGATYFGIAA